MSWVRGKLRYRGGQKCISHMNTNCLFFLTQGWISTALKNTLPLSQNNFVHYKKLREVKGRYHKIFYLPAGRVSGADYLEITRSIISDFQFISDSLLEADGQLIMFSSYGLSLLPSSEFSPYHFGKLEQEKFLTNHLDANKYLILRLPNIFGRQQPLGFLLSDLFSRKKTNHPISIYEKDKTTFLSFLWIEDLILCIEAIISMRRFSGVQYLGPSEFYSVSQIKNIFLEEHEPEPSTRLEFSEKFLRNLLKGSHMNVAAYLINQVWGK